VAHPTRLISRNWRSSIIEQRKQVDRQLKLSPSLKPFLMGAVQEAYFDGVDLAVKETRLPKFTFPNTYPNYVVYQGAK